MTDVAVHFAPRTPGPRASATRASSPPPSAAPTAGSSWLARATLALVAGALLAQLVVLVRRSLEQYHSGNVAIDFAIFDQAWQQIGHGNLSPDSTLVGYPYWRSHFELIMWPLALLGRVFPSGATLLVLQDLAIAGCEALALLWVLDVVRRDRAWRLPHLLPVLLALVLLLTNDAVRLAAVGDFHFQAFATFFLLGGARELWRGNAGRAWCWLLPALLTGDVAGTYLVGLGLSAVVARRDTRVHGLALLVVGGAWTTLVGALHASLGSAMLGYQPLVGHPLPTSGGALLVVVGAVLRHPSRPLALLWSKHVLLARDLVGTGLLGLVHPWTFGVTLVVLVENGLQSSPAYLSPFQNFPAVVFATAGTAMAVDRMARRTVARHARARLPGPAAIAAVGAVAVLAVLARPPAARGYPQRPAAAAQMSTVERALRADDQVIASFGIVGRFAGRKEISIYQTGPMPIRSSSVVFVLSATVGNEPVRAGELAGQEAYLRGLGAAPLLQAADVQAFRWAPPAGSTSVTLP